MERTIFHVPVPHPLTFLSLLKKENYDSSVLDDADADADDPLGALRVKRNSI